MTDLPAAETTPQQQLALTFEGASNCRALPNATNSQPDLEGRLWGWLHTSSNTTSSDTSGQSCAYKDKGNVPLLYVGYYPGELLSSVE